MTPCSMLHAMGCAAVGGAKVSERARAPDESGPRRMTGRSTGRGVPSLAWCRGGTSSGRY
ncbi:hypothetical protein BGZ61DRAFT_454644 [Ilyonectria robusta]|uniref:uncharacterized protein n=1 Tax=Ilyonectria robusta TaxID=1079257 RepID=UPI001E8D44F3|nr:uncharacterized protein BGZ61DRAFT_454644 [Ilyonectria robusta]KAH8686560.1 hypothetical protein BGZ61DRAFT_454644 [Ilyonectria robusta]